MAYRPRHYIIKAKKSVLLSIQDDLREWEKSGVARVRCKLMRGINQYLSVETANQHAEESFFNIVGEYREKDYWVNVEGVDFPY